MPPHGTQRASGTVMLVLGLVALAAVAPFGLFTIVFGSLLCDDPHADVRVCNTVAYGPPLVLAVVGVALTVVGAIRRRR